MDPSGNYQFSIKYVYFLFICCYHIPFLFACILHDEQQDMLIACYQHHFCQLYQYSNLFLPLIVINNKEWYLLISQLIVGLQLIHWFPILTQTKILVRMKSAVMTIVDCHLTDLSQTEQLEKCCSHHPCLFLSAVTIQHHFHSGCDAQQSSVAGSPTSFLG
jgi:hypothetical protein